MPSTSGVETTSFNTLEPTPLSDVTSVGFTTLASGSGADLVPVVTAELSELVRDLPASIVPVVTADIPPPFFLGGTSNVATVGFSTQGNLSIAGPYQPGDNLAISVLGMSGGAYTVHWSPVNDHTDAQSVQLSVISDDITAGNGSITVEADKGQVRYGDVGWLILVDNGNPTGIQATQVPGSGTLVWEVSALPPENADSWFELESGTWSIGDQIELTGFSTTPANGFTVADLIDTDEPRVRTSTGLQDWLDNGDVRQARFSVSAHNGNGWGTAGDQVLYSGTALASGSIVPVVTVLSNLRRTASASIVPRVNVAAVRNKIAQPSASLRPRITTLISAINTSLSELDETASIVPVVNAEVVRGRNLPSSASIVPIVTASAVRQRIFAFLSRQAVVQPRVDVFAVRSVAGSGEPETRPVGADIRPSVFVTVNTLREFRAVRRIRFRLLRRMMRFFRR